MDVYDYWGIKAQDERGMVQLALQKTARKMLAKGYAIADICELTGLTADEVSALTEDAGLTSLRKK